MEDRSIQTGATPRGRLATLASGFFVSVAAGVLVLAFEKELRALSRSGALLLAGILATLAVVAAIAPARARVVALANRLPRVAAIAANVILYMAPLLFVVAALMVVYATSRVEQDLLTFLAPFGPVLAGCGGAMSLAAVAASDVVRPKRRVWFLMRVEGLLAVFQVLAACAFSRFGFAVESWGLGVMAINLGIRDVHLSLALVAGLLQHAIEDRTSERRGKNGRTRGPRLRRAVPSKP